MKSTGHVTVEKTAKKLKLVQALTTLAIVVGVIWLLCVKAAHSNGMEASYAKPVATIVIAFVVRIFNRIAIWWNHG